jgi:8-oxo-dGTP pyrophosphatase MutT (NUDIX family)
VDAADENYEAAIRRELLEETGFAFSKAIYLGDTSPNPSTNANWMHMFLLTGGKKVQQQHLDGNEEIEVLIVSMEQFIQMLLSNQIVQAMHVTTIFFALHTMGKLSIRS